MTKIQIVLTASKGMNLNDTLFYSGTSGLQVHIPRRSFPPEFAGKSKLHYYALMNNSIEINSSFYKLPLVSTIQRWAADVPDYFKFTFKLWRNITHNKGLAFDAEDVGRFMSIIYNAGGHKGCLLVQFPPSLTVGHIAQLESLLGKIRRCDPQAQWRTAVEFRHSSWYCDGIYELLAGYQAAFVIQDMPASAAPFMDMDADFVYIRFHGPEGRYRGSYTDGFLYEYSLYIREWLEEGKTVYAYFNNTMGDALNNLDILRRYVQ